MQIRTLDSQKIESNGWKQGAILFVNSADLLFKRELLVKKKRKDGLPEGVQEATEKFSGVFFENKNQTKAGLEREKI